MFVEDEGARPHHRWLHPLRGKVGSLNILQKWCVRRYNGMTEGGVGAVREYDNRG